MTEKMSENRESIAENITVWRIFGFSKFPILT